MQPEALSRRVVRHLVLIEAVAQRCSVKKVFLKILPNSQENICELYRENICKLLA